MRQRQALAGQDPDGVMGDGADLSPLAEAPSPQTAFARAKALQRIELEKIARSSRN